MNIERIPVDEIGLYLCDEQKEAVRKIRTAASICSSFGFKGVHYVLQNTPYRGNTIEAFPSTSCESRVGIIHDYTPYHRSIDVDTTERGRGIGTTLFRTKIAIDGLLRFETTRRQDRLLFLMKNGYIPIAVAGYATAHSSTLSWDMVVSRMLNELHESRQTIDIGPYRLEFNPGKVHQLSHELGLGFDSEKLPKIKK